MNMAMFVARPRSSNGVGGESLLVVSSFGVVTRMALKIDLSSL